MTSLEEKMAAMNPADAFLLFAKAERARVSVAA